MLDLYFRDLGLKETNLQINSLGCPICRPKFIKAFLDFLLKNESLLCSDCKRRIERNPLRALDCRQEGCRQLTSEGPSIQDHLCEDCERDFDTVLETLGTLGTGYQINPRIVRGLDYYLKTTFEFASSVLGAQDAVAGGGRFDGLVRLMGGQNIPGFGFAMGVERLVEVLQKAREKRSEKERQGVFIATLGEKAVKEALKIVQQLRSDGVLVDVDYDGKSLKSQMRRADKAGVRYVVLLGDQEIEKKRAALRDLNSGRQEDLPLTGLATHLKNLS